jgi:DNA-binding transcriptional regulator YhcF (GntR family)
LLHAAWWIKVEPEATMAMERVGASGAIFEPVRQDRNFEVVVQRVRDKLMRGELKPGDKLPPERELATQLNVSRNVVREALRILENAGLVHTKKGAYGGAFVSPGSPTQMSQVLGDLKAHFLGRDDARTGDHGKQAGRVPVQGHERSGG